ncbi:hypothetical protein D3C76_1349930 [compost metagenome]
MNVTSVVDVNKVNTYIKKNPAKVMYLVNLLNGDLIYMMFPMIIEITPTDSNPTTNSRVRVPFIYSIMNPADKMRTMIQLTTITIKFTDFSY